MGAKGLGSRGIIGSYYMALGAYPVPPWVTMVGMPVDSDQETETYKWLGMVPQMRQWLGQRHIRELVEKGMTITNHKYESTLLIDADELRRDKTPQIRARINEQARRTNAHWAKLASDLIIAGSATTCYDGQYFFDNDHSEGDSGTQKNLLTASEVGALDINTATAPTVAEAEAALRGVIAYFFTYKDDVGEPMNEDATEFLVMTNTAMNGAFQGAIAGDVIHAGSGGYDNLLKRTGWKIYHVVNPRLDASITVNFFVFRVDSNLKSIILQTELEPTMQVLDESSDWYFMNDSLLYGIKASRGIGFGYWQFAIKATFS